MMHSRSDVASDDRRSGHGRLMQMLRPQTLANVGASTYPRRRHCLGSRLSRCRRNERERRGSECTHEANTVADDLLEQAREMSLTGALEQRGSPLSGFFEERFPLDRVIKRQVRELAQASGLPTIETPGVDRGTIGTAIDYRCKLCFVGRRRSSSYWTYKGENNGGWGAYDEDGHLERGFPAGGGRLHSSMTRADRAG
jgi:hypothetical protein